LFFILLIGKSSLSPPQCFPCFRHAVLFVSIFLLSKLIPNVVPVMTCIFCSLRSHRSRRVLHNLFGVAWLTHILITRSLLALPTAEVLIKFSGANEHLYHVFDIADIPTSDVLVETDGSVKHVRLARTQRQCQSTARGILPIATTRQERR